MTIEQVPPGLILIVSALALPLMRGWWRSALVLLAPLAALWLVWQIPDGATLSTGFLGLEMVIVKGDKLSRLFGTIFCIMAFAGGLFALRQARTIELTAALFYAGSAIGVAFAGDLITVFVFWELMALGSTIVIWSADGEAARRAGMRYVMIHLLGGVLLMAGIVDFVIDQNSVAFGAGPIHEMLTVNRPGTWLILAGFLINAGAPPLSAWLPDAYPESSPTGMVFLSAFTTKTAVYVLWRGFQGFDVLIWIGLFMVFYGIIYALLENDMRRILAYSIINQVGFMVCGIGIGTHMALNGAAAHAFTHIIYKALLLMSAGSVLHMTGKRKCTDLGGLFQSMPLTCICGIIGALSISSFPLTSGFVSKSMISQAAADQHLAVVWFLLAAASAGVFLHAGIKFPWFVFFQKDSGLRPPDPPWNMRLAMILFAFLCIFLGVWIELLYALLPLPVNYKPYTGYHVVEMLQLLLFSGLAFFVLLPFMKRTLTISLDVDWFWRRFGAMLAREFTIRGGRARGLTAERLEKRLAKALETVFHFHGPKGILARTWDTGATTLVIVGLLAVYLVVYFL
jgi:multicomponent Na+:H+ antiporter subunit D